MSVLPLFWMVACVTSGPSACAPPPSLPDATDSMPPIPSTDSRMLAEPGFVEGVAIAPDITGDGVQDVLVHTSYPAQTFVVPGPLRNLGGIDLDEQAVAVVVHDNSWIILTQFVGDMDGDGVTDVFSEGRVVYGPLDGDADDLGVYRANEAWVYDGWPVDVDGDGVMERVTPKPGAILELYEASRDPASPRAVLQSTCRTGAQAFVRAFPDLDGDGVGELVWTSRPVDQCPPRWLPADVRGTVQVEDFPIASDEVQVVLGDVTGDGAPELMTWSDSVRSGPFDLTQPTIGGTEIADLSHPSTPSLEPLPFDLDGDGLAELEYHLLNSSDVRLIVSWPSGIDQPLITLPMNTEVADSRAAYAVEEGHAIMVEVAGGTTSSARVVDLGPLHAGEEG